MQHQNSSKSSQTSTKLECKAQSQEYIYDFNHITNVKKIEMTSVSCAKNGDEKRQQKVSGNNYIHLILEQCVPRLQP